MTDTSEKNRSKNAAGNARVSTHPGYRSYTLNGAQTSAPNASGRVASRPEAPGRTAAGPNRTAGTAQTVRQQPNAKNPGAVRGNPGPQNARTGNPGGASGVHRTAVNPVHTGRSGTAPRPGDPAAKAERRAAGRSAAGAAVKKEKKKKEKKKRQRVRRKIFYHTVEEKTRYAFPASIVLVAVTFTILVLSVVTTLVEINEITEENSAYQNRYASLVTTENELRLRLETRDDLRAVEKKVTEEFGMVKKDQVTKYHLSVRKYDKIELVEDAKTEKTSFFEDIGGFFTSVSERITLFFSR